MDLCPEVGVKDAWSAPLMLTEMEDNIIKLIEKIIKGGTYIR